jgi:prepilin-type N-terminal cleavage/methylation domain-containing protein
MRRLWNNQAGYTLIEMVVMMAIITILSALVLANTKIGDQRQQRRDAVAGFVTTAHQAEVSAASSQVTMNSPSSSGIYCQNNGTTCPRPAYGVCLSVAGQTCNPGAVNPTVYQMYARAQGDTSTTQPTSAQVLKQYSLPSNTVLVALVGTGASCPAAGAGAFWVEYAPPGPSIMTNGSNQSYTIWARSTKDTTYCAKALVNPGAGAVYVQ